jgi:hypothetical protein
MQDLDLLRQRTYILSMLFLYSGDMVWALIYAIVLELNVPSRLIIEILTFPEVMGNVQATVLLGAQIIFMPHVTMCILSSRPGAGFVDPKLWLNRDVDPTSLRLEFEGMEGR